MNIEDVLKGHGIGVGGGSTIKSVQRGTLTLDAKDKFLTISPVDINKSIIRVTTNLTYSTGDPYYFNIKASIVDNTTILLQAGSYDVNFPCEIKWEVIEFENVKLLQKGEASLLGDLSVTISNINIDKSILFFSFMSSTSGQSSNSYLVSGYIKDTQTIVFRQKPNANKNLHWQVIEFN